MRGLGVRVQGGSCEALIRKSGRKEDACGALGLGGTRLLLLLLLGAGDGCREHLEGEGSNELGGGGREGFKYVSGDSPGGVWASPWGWI